MVVRVYFYKCSPTKLILVHVSEFNTSKINALRAFKAQTKLTKNKDNRSAFMNKNRVLNQIQNRKSKIPKIYLKFTQTQKTYANFVFRCSCAIGKCKNGRISTRNHKARNKFRCAFFDNGTIQIPDQFRLHFRFSG